MTSVDFCVHRAMAGDTPAISTLLIEVFSPFQIHFQPTALKFDVDRILAELDRWYVVRGESGILGCMMSWGENDYQTFCFLARHPDYRSQGIAKALVEHAIYLARRAKFKKIRIALRHSVEQNIEYFSRYGFKYLEPFPTGEHSLYQLEWAAHE